MLCGRYAVLRYACDAMCAMNECCVVCLYTVEAGRGARGWRKRRRSGEGREKTRTPLKMWGKIDKCCSRTTKQQEELFIQHEQQEQQWQTGKTQRITTSQNNILILTIIIIIVIINIHQDPPTPHPTLHLRMMCFWPPCPSSQCRRQGCELRQVRHPKAPARRSPTHLRYQSPLPRCLADHWAQGGSRSGLPSLGRPSSKSYCLPQVMMVDDDDNEMMIATVMIMIGIMTTMKR